MTNSTDRHLRLCPQAATEADLFAALDLETHHATAAVHLGFCQIVLGMIGAEGIEHPCHLFLLAEEIGHRFRILAMLLHAQFQGLQAFEVQPGIEGTDAGTGVADEDLQILIQKFPVA